MNHTLKRWRWWWHVHVHVRVMYPHPAPVLLPASPDPVQPDPLLKHPLLQALLVSARLASLPSSLVDLAVVRSGTGVVDATYKRSTKASKVENKGTKFYFRNSFAGELYIK